MKRRVESCSSVAQSGVGMHSWTVLVDRIPFLISMLVRAENFEIFLLDHVQAGA